MKIYILLAVFVFVFCYFVNDTNAQMRIHHINVGQADATLLEFRRAAILVDAGGSSFGGNRDRDHLLDYLDKFFERRSDLNKTLYSFIITHPRTSITHVILWL
jgi:hypothetical protein